MRTILGHFVQGLMCKIGGTRLFDFRPISVSSAMKLKVELENVVGLRFYRLKNRPKIVKNRPK